jgi:hypothetical protein
VQGVSILPLSMGFWNCSASMVSVVFHFIREQTLLLEQVFTLGSTFFKRFMGRELAQHFIVWQYKSQVINIALL